MEEMKKDGERETRDDIGVTKRNNKEFLSFVLFERKGSGNLNNWEDGPTGKRSLHVLREEWKK